MKMMRLLPALTLAAGLLPLAGTSAQAAIRTGTLSCDIAGGMGYILASSKDVSCRFTDFDGNTELYTGTVSKFGVDIGITHGAHVVWAVFEPALEPGSLAGSYAGVMAEATVGAGVGANVLVGGGNGGVTLQPLSVQGQTGFNVAAAIGSLSIALAPPPAVGVVVHHYRHHYRHHYHGRHHHYHRYHHVHHYYHHHHKG